MIKFRVFFGGSFMSPDLINIRVVNPAFRLL